MSLAQTIQTLISERETQFLELISRDYNLSIEELKEKYCTETETEKEKKKEKAPRKYTKATVVTEKKCCTAQTSKKEPCKFAALKGEVFCKRHLKSNTTSETEKPAASSDAPPVHTHALTDTTTPCELCESHGNPLAEPDEEEFEIAEPEEPEYETEFRYGGEEEYDEE